MGMDYYIMPDKEIDCKNEFPERLSQFFEQVEGYGERAEASQVSRILTLDLTLFQDMEYDAHDESEDDAHWHQVDEYLSVIAVFINKINDNPLYHTQVLHNAKPASSKFVIEELQRIMTLPSEKEQEQEWAVVQAKYEKLCPPDYGYLSSGQILKDLQTLQQTLLCYKSSGVIKARLFYA